MLEIEVKFPADFEAVRARLAGRPFREEPAREESDEYFNAPDRDFAATDEALRVRRTGEAGFVTYKGPKTDSHTKTRVEVEVPLALGAGTLVDFRKLLLHLGYRPAAVVRKTRRVLRLERGGFPVELCLDEVEGLGRFVELEIRAPGESLEAAKAALLGLAEELGLSGSERRSYLELLLGR
ncbi:MAG: class IV adenylate cyclase [Elusimicrobiota bacterium]